MSRLVADLTLVAAVVLSTTERSWGEEKPALPRESITSSLGMTLVLIPAGTFRMGAGESENDAFGYEKPAHDVRITKAFYLGAMR